MMGIEVDTKYNGAGGSFFSTLLAIEEIAKVDPSVSAMVDIHNTLVNRVFMVYANEEQRKRFLPRLSTDTVSIFFG